MFSEILRIKPILDKAATAAMEAGLHKRFARVAGRFGAGLKNVIKGSIIGISLGLLAKILNPLQAIEDKIKDLMGQGTDLRDMASRFNTSTGNIQRLQSIGQSLGVKPEELRDMMTKYAQAVEKARIELLDPSTEMSSASRAVAQFVDMQDMAESFFAFTQSLKKFGGTHPADAYGPDAAISSAYQKRKEGKPLTEEETLALVKYQKSISKTGMDARRMVETDIFGAPLNSAEKRFVDADQGANLKNLKLPHSWDVTAAADKFADLAQKKTILDVQNETKDFIQASKNTTPRIIELMAAAEKRERDFETKQIKNYEALHAGAQAVIDLKEGLQNLLGKLTELFTYLRPITSFLMKLTASRWWNNIGGGK